MGESPTSKKPEHMQKRLIIELENERVRKWKYREIFGKVGLKCLTSEIKIKLEQVLMLSNKQKLIKLINDMIHHWKEIYKEAGPEPSLIKLHMARGDD